MAKWIAGQREIRFRSLSLSASRHSVSRIEKPKYLFISILSLFYYYCVMRYVYKINKTKSTVFNLCNVKWLFLFLYTIVKSAFNVYILHDFPARAKKRKSNPYTHTYTYTHTHTRPKVFCKCITVTISCYFVKIKPLISVNLLAKNKKQRNIHISIYT